LEHEFKFS